MRVKLHAGHSMTIYILIFGSQKFGRDRLTSETMINWRGAKVAFWWQQWWEFTLVLYRYWGQHSNPLYHEWSLDNGSHRKQPLIEWYRNQEKDKEMCPWIMMEDHFCSQLLLHTSSMFSKPFSSNVRIANDGEIIFLLRRNIFTTIQLWRNEKRNLGGYR